MSKVFWDNYLELDKVDKHIKALSKTHEEKLELWQLVDEMVHHRVLGCILDHLPESTHEEFLQKFSEAPHDEKLIVYLKEKMKKDVVVLIKEAVAVLVMELIGELEIKNEQVPEIHSK